MPVEAPKTAARPWESCANFQESSFAWSDGELSGSERDAIAAHLLHCQPCRLSFAADSVFRSAVRDAAVTERAPDTLRERVGRLLDRSTIAKSA
jgi:mycothiol system anti-sigma-R factor